MNYDWSIKIADAASRLVSVLCERGWTVSAAESCTGGLVAAAITAVAGASQCFNQSLVTYSNESKHHLLGVPNEVLQTYGAVSTLCAEHMALGVLKQAQANLAVAVTGIAGPTGGTDDKPVGTVFIGCALRVDAHKTPQVAVVRYRFEGDRDQVRLQSVHQALHDLLKMLELFD